MNSEWFEKVINEQIKTCTDVLIGKAKEYATDDDRLHNFKNAAGMMGCDAKNALAGMMAKHTISIYDMCRNGKDYPIELWNEKITDHINYLLLLKAVVEEDSWHEILEHPIEDLMEHTKTIDGKQVEIKKPSLDFIDQVIDSLRYCNGDTYEPCYLSKDYGGECPAHLREDAAELLENYKSMLRIEKDTTDVVEEETPVPEPIYANKMRNLAYTVRNQLEKEAPHDNTQIFIKENKDFLDELIRNFRLQLKICARADCDYCPHRILEKDCDEGLVAAFDNIITRLKDAKTEIPPVKPEIALRINQFKDQIKRCSTAECNKCPYDPMTHRGKDCDTPFIQDFEKLIADVVEYAHNEPTFRGTNDGKC